MFAALRVGIDLPNVTPEAVAPTAAIRFPPPPTSTQDLVNAAFGIDPSLSPVDAPRTMAQAMWMMNNEQLQAADQRRARQRHDAGRSCSNEVQDDSRACERLYAASAGPRADGRGDCGSRLRTSPKLGDRRAGVRGLAVEPGQLGRVHDATIARLVNRSAKP